MNRKKIIIIVVAIILISIILYYVFRKKNTGEFTSIQPNLTPGTPTPVPAPVMSEFPLKEGSRGENVKRMQYALNRISGKDPINVDGVFGSQTRTKILTTLATSQYSFGPTISSKQLTEIIKKSNSI